jgi:prepilin peptidase CpaA
MTWHALLLFAPFVVMLCWAAAEDLRTGRIPNWLTLAIAATGVMQAFTAHSTVGPLGSACGLLLGGAIMLPLFAIGALGGGDVKLLAGVGAWLGPIRAFEVFLAAAVIGMLLVIVQSILQGRLRTLLRNSILVAVNLAHIRQVGTKHAIATGASCRSVDRPLPYAVPMLLATLMMLLLGPGRVP